MSLFSRGVRIPILLSWCWLLPALAQAGQGLSLSDAQALALGQDPELSRLEARREGMAEQAVAAGQLPDPGVKLGLMSLPVDSFALDREPMTQLVVSAQQMFPAGQTRQLRREQGLVRSRAQSAMADDRRRSVVNQVRRLWLELGYRDQAMAVVSEQISLYESLAGTVETRYTSGRGGQQDIIRLELEKDLLREKLIGLRRDAAELRASLSEWIGEGAFGELVLEQPALPALPEQGNTVEQVAAHPMVLADQVQLEASEVGERLARERYKPDWGLEVSYGHRQGADPMGGSREDFLSAMVMFSVPLFTADRQDRMAAAARAETRAAVNQVKNRQRTLAARVNAGWERYREQGELLTLYRDQVVPAARSNVTATLNAYQGQRASFDEYVRAENMALEKHLRMTRLETDLMQAQVDLLYLIGETP